MAQRNDSHLFYKQICNLDSICLGMLLVWTSLVAQLLKNPSEMRETWVWALGWEDPLKKGKATHSRILAYSMDSIVHGVTKSRTQLSNFHFGNTCLCSTWRRLEGELENLHLKWLPHMAKKLGVRLGLRDWALAHFLDSPFGLGFLIGFREEVVASVSVPRGSQEEAVGLELT